MDRVERFDDPTEALNAALDGKQAQIWTALPGIIESYDPAAMTVSVQPAIQGSKEDETGAKTPEKLPLLVDVPVVFPRGGGFTLTFPIKGGDECLVIFASRCIDSWWQSGGVQEQAESRMHDLSDGFALVGPSSQARNLTPQADSENTQLRSDDGKNSVTITPSGVITAEAATQLILRAPNVRIEGALSISGLNGGDTTAELQGTLRATDDLIANGKSGFHHTHPGIQPGSGSTGQPQ